MNGFDARRFATREAGVGRIHEPAVAPIGS
jgi:hypothetical protein